MHLTVIPIDKQIYLETPNATYYPTQFPNRRCHIINDQEFWNDVDSRIHAIQYHSDGDKHIEYKNPQENVSITDINILQKYIAKFNLAEQLFQNQIVWDNNNIQKTLADGTKKDETLQEKIDRIGPRP